MAELLAEQPQWIVSYHEHDSLLEQRPEEDLTEEERRSAWEEYERERQGLYTAYEGLIGAPRLQQQQQSFPRVGHAIKTVNQAVPPRGGF